MAYQGRWTNAAHNELLQAWAELGIVGVALLVALLAAAWFALLKDLSQSEGRERRRRVTLAALLAAWALHAQMNFALQTPVGALSLYALLLATVLESHARASDSAMPSLRWEAGWLALRVDSRNMRQPTALGMAFIGPAWVGMAAGLLLIVGVAAWIPQRLGPVRAQREYRGAMESLVPATRRGSSLQTGAGARSASRRCAQPILFLASGAESARRRAGTIADRASAASFE